MYRFEAVHDNQALKDLFHDCYSHTDGLEDSVAAEERDCGCHRALSQGDEATGQPIARHIKKRPNSE